jgi:hypothetical protein
MSVAVDEWVRVTPFCVVVAVMVGPAAARNPKIKPKPQPVPPLFFLIFISLPLWTPFWARISVVAERKKLHGRFQRGCARVSVCSLESEPKPSPGGTHYKYGGTVSNNRVT